MGGQCPRLGSWRIQWGWAKYCRHPWPTGDGLRPRDPQTSEAFGYIAAGLITLTWAVARSFPMSSIAWWILFIVACGCLISVALWLERKKRD